MEGITRFSFPTSVVFGPGAIRQLPAYLEEVGITKALIVTDGGFLQTEAFGAVQDVLKTAGSRYALFSDVHPNPLDEDIAKAAAHFHSQACDGVIGLGGGSALDAAKVVSVLAVNEGSVNKYDCATGGNTSIRGPLPPLLAIPTTAGTGSEVGRCAVITSKSQGRKFMVCNPLMMPQMALLDPQLTTGLPAALTAATGMDAFTHCVESLTCPVFHPMCDAIAIKGIEICARYLEEAVKTPLDIEARGYMQLAAMMGAVAFQKDLGAAHSLSHALSAVCGLQHGLANAICLTPVMKYTAPVAGAAYAKVAACFGINIHGLSADEAAAEAIRAVEALNRKIGIPPRLSDVGVDEAQLAEVAQKAFLDPCHQTNARPCTQTDLMALLKEAF